MTRLDQLDAYRTEFVARLEEVRADGGAVWWRLDASAFYPTSGGQPHDTGTFEAAAMDGAGTETEAAPRWRVVDVRIDDGAVWHRVAPGAPASAEGAPAGAAADGPPVGAPLRGRLDAERRLRHMRRHTAQHLLSQAFVRCDAAFATRSVALTSPDLTLDLAGDPDDEALRAAERLVNEVAARALPIRAFEVDERDLERYPLRRPPKVRGRLRIVEMGTWERSACGGTHLRSTAEALPILILGRERVRGGDVRVTFRAGLEATEAAAATHRAAAEAAVLLSSRIGELPARVAGLLDEAAAARRALAGARAAHARTLATTLVAADPAPSDPVVACTLRGEDAALADDLADALAAAGRVAAVAAVEDARVRLVLTSGAGVDVRPALRAALERIDGRGGGRPERAQGAGGAVERADDALRVAAAELRAALAAAPPGAPSGDAEA